MPLPNTYGQVAENNGKPISWQEFQKELGSRLKQYGFLIIKKKHLKLSKRLFNKGYTIADTIGMIMLHD